MTTVPEEPAADPATEPGPSPDDVETAELVKDDDVLSEAAGIVDDVAERALEPQDVTAMDALDANRRLLLVHAHPDDETIGNGATMARYVAEGEHVTLLTCTLGEEGEVLVPELAQLAAGQADQLGGYRIWELRGAMAALGVT